MTNLEGKARTIHVHMTVAFLLEQSNKRLSEFVSHPDGMEGARKELRAMLNEGETCLVIDSSCDNRKPDGSCAGHAVEGDE